MPTDPHLPIIINFSSESLKFRLKHKTKELLIKALGKLKLPSIVDATAGLGVDSFILAAHGMQLEMIERSPIIAQVLHDALVRGAQDPAIAQIIGRMKLRQGDALTILPQLHPDVIYLDPMFPHKSKTALVKKEMRLLQEAVGGDADAPALLALALTQAKQRVIVKRPRHASSIAGIKPSYQLTGSAARFDIYVK
jgi:16S rRNA (guanine1516-N2)-methyltransferase